MTGRGHIELKLTGGTVRLQQLEFQTAPSLVHYWPPMKLVPLSKWSEDIGPLRERNILRAFINLSVVMTSSISKCTARLDRHVNNTT